MSTPMNKVPDASASLPPSYLPQPKWKWEKGALIAPDGHHAIEPDSGVSDEDADFLALAATAHPFFKEALERIARMKGPSEWLSDPSQNMRDIAQSALAAAKGEKS